MHRQRMQLMVNKENMTKWIAALRSGEFMQGKGTLRSGVAYCCLGVACEVFRRETANGDWFPQLFGYERFEFHAGLGYTVGVLPAAVVAWLGLEETSPSVYMPEYDRLIALTELNDTRDYDFAQIADILESTYLNQS